ncbi:hypothetical protein OAD28_09255 [Flavobacteriales bacterium]|nr:hypothetical protein [Flavobacteriales bacterium]
MKKIHIILIATFIFASCKKEIIRETTIIENSSSISTFVVDSNNWRVSNQFLIATIDIPAITQEIIDKGAVLIYQKENASWISLPFSFTMNASSPSTFVRVNHFVGYITIYRSNSDYSVPSNPGVRTFKCVILTGDQLASHPEIDINNIQELTNLEFKD